MAGVTPTGFEGRSFDAVFEGLKEKVRGALGATISLVEQNPESAIARVVAEEVSDVWAAVEAVYLAFDESAAAGAALENLAAITGTERLQAAPSTVTLTATGEAGTVLPVGRVASVEATGARFATTAEATLVAVPPWTPSTPYAAGARVTTSNPTARVYVCTTAGASAAIGAGPTGVVASIPDGGAVWAYVGDGATAVDVAAAGMVTGPVSAVAGTVTQKDTPVAGWQSVTNLQDAVLGRNVETDAAFRARRRRELRGLGNASVPAIRERLADPDLVAGVIDVTIFENDTNAVNADGMPPHSVEALVEGGDDQTIRNVLWASKAAGIYTHGVVSGTVTDAEGVVHTVRFTRPTILQVWVAGTVQLTPDAPALDSDALAQIQAAVLAYGDALPAGLDVVRRKVEGAMTALSWVFDVVGVGIGLSAGTVGPDNIPVTTRQRADFDTSRMTFTLQRLTAADL